MEKICQYCNGLENLNVCCPTCGEVMSDCGTLQEELGPYAPYEENTLLHQQYQCAHHVYCPHCQSGYYLSIPENDMLPLQ